MKRRMTENKRRILEALRPIQYHEIHDPADPEDPDAWWKGQAPYIATQVARNTGLDRSNASRTLKGLLKEGLIVSELRDHRMAHFMNGLNRKCVKRLPHYWVVATQEIDRVIVSYQEQTAKEADELRREAFLDKLFDMLTPEQEAQLQNAIERRNEKMAALWDVFKKAEARISLPYCPSSCS